MEKLIILRSDLPREEIAIVEELVRSSDFICSGFDVDVLEPYTARDYVSQKHFHGNEIHAILDRNLVSSLTRCAREGSISSDDEQEAVRLLNFLRIAEVELEPGISLAEYADTYYAPNPAGELEFLRMIDDIPNENLHALALGKSKDVAIVSSAYRGPTILKTTVSAGEKLHRWKLHFGYALKIFLLHHENHSKMDFVKEFLQWMWKDYAIGGVALTFAATFASEKFGRMIKGINSLNREKVLKGIRNAAWDMTIVHYWSHQVVHREDGEPFCIFCTADKGLKSVARNVIGSEETSIQAWCRSVLGDSLTPQESDEIAALYLELNEDNSNPARAVHEYRIDQDHFDPYIAELQSEVEDLIEHRAQQDGPGHRHPYP
jgi:hypothetical protein